MENPDVLNYVRIGYVSVQIFVVSVYFYVSYVVSIKMSIVKL